MSQQAEVQKRTAIDVDKETWDRILDMLDEAFEERSFEERVVAQNLITDVFKGTERPSAASLSHLAVVVITG